SDWYRLIEICALTNTLVIDEDGVYDPTVYSDRLLLGFLSGATYPTVIPLSRHPGRYSRGSSPRCRRPLRHRDGLLLEGGCPMARPATARRPADGRPGRLDRSTRRCISTDPGPTPAGGPRPASPGPTLPAAPAPPGDAPLPDPLVLRPPVVAPPVHQPPQPHPAVVADRLDVLVVEVDGVHQLAIDVDLELTVRPVADPHRPR